MRRMIEQALAGVFLVALPLCIGSVSAEAGCDPRGRRSLHSEVPTRITFVNQSGSYRRLEWLGFDGRAKDYGGLNAGESKSIDTFLTHPWLITDGPSDCLQIVMPRPGGSVVRLGGSRPSRPE